MCDRTPEADGTRGCGSLESFFTFLESFAAGAAADTKKSGVCEGVMKLNVCNQFAVDLLLDSFFRLFKMSLSL